MLKKKKKSSCCVNASCFAAGRDDSSSDLEYEKDYEKYGREYEREYARLCELQRSLTSEERSKRSEATTSFGQSTFSRRYSSFDTLEITEEQLDREIQKASEQKLDDESDYDVEYEILMKEAEEAELLDRRGKNHDEEEKQMEKNEELARKKTKREEEIERKKRQDLAQREKEEQEIARKRREREEEENVRGEKEELARIRREEEIARRQREELARKKREEEENGRRMKEEQLSRKKLEEEEERRKKQEEENERRMKEELSRKKWEEENERRMKELSRKKWEEENERKKRQEEEENLRRMKEELSRQKWEEDENMRRQKEELSKKSLEEENERRKRQEENVGRQRDELARRKHEEERNERRKRDEEKNVRRQREDLPVVVRKKLEEESERRKRVEEEEAARRKLEEENARRNREEFARRKLEEQENARRKREVFARRKLEEEENARRKKEELAKKEEEEIARRRKEEQTRRDREQDEIARRRSEEVARRKRVEEEEIARRKNEEEDQMEGLQTHQDLSWMSVTQQAKNRGRGVSMNGERIDRIQRTDSAKYEATPSASRRGTQVENEDVSTRGISFKEGGWHNEWREAEFVEDEQQEEDVKLIRNRIRWGKEVARDDFDDGASSSTSELPSDEWDSGKPTKNPFSPVQLHAGFQQKFLPQREELLSRFEQQLLSAARIPKNKLHSRLNNSATLFFGILGVALLMSLFVLHLSVSRMRPPGECVNERIILNFSATRIRLRGGRYVSFREQGVGADRAEHSVVVVHDLLSSRLAGIPGINESLLEEYRVRLISYDRPGYGQSDTHFGRNYNTSAYDIVEIADALNLGEKFWVVGFGGGGPHVWAAINYLPERLAGVAMFAPAGNPYVSSMSKEEIEETWGVLTPRQKWMHTLARRFPALLPRLLQKTAITNSPYVPRNVRLSLGQKDQKWMAQPNVKKSWEEDIKEALRHGCAFAIAEELTLLVNDWGFSLSELPFTERAAKTIFHHVASLFSGEKKPKIFEGPIHIWQGTEDQLVPMTINSVAKRLVEQNNLLDLSMKPSPVKLHYLPGEGHFSWFWFCDECHRRIFQTLFRPNETLEAEEEAAPLSSKGFSKDDYEAIIEAFAALKMRTPEPENGRGTAGRMVDNSAATIKDREEEFQRVLQNGLQNKRIQEEYLKQQKAEATRQSKRGRFSSKDSENEGREEIHPMTCRATNHALKDKSVLYVCPEDDDLLEGTDSIHQHTDSNYLSKSKTARKRDVRDTNNSKRTYLEVLSTLVKRLARKRK